MTSKIRQARAFAVVAAALLALGGCSDPGSQSDAGKTPLTGAETTGTETTGTEVPGAEIAGDETTEAGAPASGTSVVQTFNLSPDQNRVTSDVSKEAAALVPAAIGADGKLTVAVSPGVPPLASYATDNTTVIGNEVDIAYALGDALGLDVEIIPTAWADWPLGVESGKYEVALSNITVTEARKEKFDFASYRNDQLGFYARGDSPISEIKDAADVAGKRVIVGSGTNQELILLAWDKENRANGLEPVQFQYYDDDSASALALQSGRADLTFGPNATAAYKAATDGKTKLVGQVNGGWPLQAQLAVTTARGNGFAAAAQAGLNHLMANGIYADILARWGLSSEAIVHSELNPPGLPET